MCVAVNKGNFVSGLAGAISSQNMVPATLPFKNGSSFFSEGLNLFQSLQICVDRCIIAACKKYHFSSYLRRLFNHAFFGYWHTEY